MLLTTTTTTTTTTAAAAATTTTTTITDCCCHHWCCATTLYYYIGVLFLSYKKHSHRTKSPYTRTGSSSTVVCQIYTYKHMISKY